MSHENLVPGVGVEPFFRVEAKSLENADLVYD